MTLGPTAAVILAAGSSTRLGSPKQLARLGAETLLERAVRVATEAGCMPIIVVLGAHAARIQATCNLADAQIHLNPNWAEGMGASLRAGVESIPDRAADLIVMTCDQPAVSPGHLRALIVESRRLHAIVCTSYADRHGVPACFPSQLFASLRGLGGDAGARSLLASAASIHLLYGELDIDTAQNLEEARQRFG